MNGNNLSTSGLSSVCCSHSIETGALVSKQETYGGNKFRNFDLHVTLKKSRVGPYSTLLAVIELGSLVFPEI